MSEQCSKDLGTRLVLRAGKWSTEPYRCSKPATASGLCVQHDRMARGLSGKWPRREPEQADGMTAAKARDDLERGTAHFDREFVEWRGTEVEVVD